MATLLNDTEMLTTLYSKFSKCEVLQEGCEASTDIPIFFKERLEYLLWLWFKGMDVGEENLPCALWVQCD